MVSRLLENRPLLKECIEALKVGLLPDDESEKVSDMFRKIVPITKWGKVDWAKINKKIEVGYDPQLLISALEKLMGGPFDTSVYIEWSSSGVPIIKADLKDIVDNFDDVTCVAFEKFIFNPSAGYIIEILPSDLMTIGIIPDQGNS